MTTAIYAHSAAGIISVSLVLKVPLHLSLRSDVMPRGSSVLSNTLGFSNLGM